MSGVEFNRVDVMDLIPVHLQSIVHDSEPAVEAKMKRRGGGPPFNSQHFYAAAQVARALSAMSESEFAALKVLNVGDMLTEHYAGTNHSPPSDDNRERAGAAILQAFTSGIKSG